MSQNISNVATITYNGEPLPPTCPVITTIDKHIKISKSVVTDNGVYIDDNINNEIGDGDTLLFQIQLINYSSVSFTNVVFEDELLLSGGVTVDMLTFLNPPQSSYANEATLPTIKFTLPEIPSQSVLNVFYKIKLSDNVPVGGVIKNQASVDYDENTSENPISSNLVSVVNTSSSSSTTVEAIKTGPDNVFCNQIFDYVLTFNNTGSKIATDVTVTDYLPTQFVLSSIKVVNGGNLLTENVNYSYSVNPTTNVLTITSIQNGLDINPQESLVITIAGSVPCTD